MTRPYDRRAILRFSLFGAILVASPAAFANSSIRRWIILAARPAGLERGAFVRRALTMFQRDREIRRGSVLFGETIDDPNKPAGNSATGAVDAVIAVAGDSRAFLAVQAILRELASPVRVLMVRTETFLEPSDRSVRVTTLLRRQPEASHDAFAAHMLSVHGPLSRSVRGLDGYAMSVVDRDEAPPAPSLFSLGQIDAVGEGWIGGGAAVPDTPERARWLADGKANFGNVIRIVTRDTYIGR